MVTSRRSLGRDTAAMNESTWQRQVIEMATADGWRVMHVRRSRSSHLTATSVPGWPDLVLWRPGRFMVAELKTETGRPTAQQRDVLASLDAAGVTTHLWRPSDRDAIEATLRGRSRLLDAWEGR